MQSDDVQALLFNLAYTVFATNLPAERGLATVKRNEASKLLHVARASCNMIHRRFLRKRDAAVARLEAAENADKRARKMRPNVLALARHSEWMPRGVRVTDPEWRPRDETGAGRQAKRGGRRKKKVRVDLPQRKNARIRGGLPAPPDPPGGLPGGRFKGKSL